MSHILVKLACGDVACKAKSSHFILSYFMSSHAHFKVFNGHVFSRVLSIRVCVYMCFYQACQ